MTFRVANIVAALLFFASAVVQYNDPDPLRWMAIYGGGAAACVVSLRGRFSWLLPAVVGVAALIWASSIALSVLPVLRFTDLFKTMKASTPAIEEGREMLGLLLVASWMAGLALRSRWVGAES